MYYKLLMQINNIMIKNKLKVFEYSSNNSGGSWWLSKEEWLSLEKAGWVVKWGDGDFIWKNGSYVRDENGIPTFEVNDNLWLGAHAKYAFLLAETEEEAIESFNKHSGNDYYDTGCECCGEPHNISDITK